MTQVHRISCTVTKVSQWAPTYWKFRLYPFRCSRDVNIIIMTTQNTTQNAMQNTPQNTTQNTTQNTKLNTTQNTMQNTSQNTT